MALLSPWRWLPLLVRAVLPSSCVLCGALGDEPVCPACAQAHARGVHVRCPCCANPVGALDAGRHCGACLADPPAFDATVAACDYAAPVDALVLQLKFGARLALAPWMAGRVHAAAASCALPDLLCPVPLGPRRLVERGYNQALEMALPLSKTLGIPLAPRLLERRLETAAQSGVAPGERRRNVRGAFAVADGQPPLAGRHVGVVDDVMTSGHTLDELAGVLKRAGAARVTNFVFARTPPH
jgi:ComF family protein